MPFCKYWQKVSESNHLCANEKAFTEYLGTVSLNSFHRAPAHSEEVYKIIKNVQTESNL